MPFSYAQYPGNGSTVTFTVPFPYLLRAHVKLYYGLSLQSGGYTQLLVDGVNYSWTSATQVQLTAAPVVGQTLSIRRETPTTSRLVDWNDGSALTADALDTADLQNFYAIQEHKDYIEALSINPNTNVADGSITANKLSSDAVTTSKIQDQAVTANKLSTDAVTTSKIQDQAVTSGKIADGTIVNADVNANAGIVASKLSFAQAGTGAVTQTVESKLREAVSVLDFIPTSEHAAIGAGTSTYDCKPGIQAAIDYLFSLFGKGDLYFPSGLYRAYSSIIQKNGVTLSGPANPWTNVTGTAWSNGAVIYKAHNGDCIQSGIGSQVIGVAIKNLAIQSDSTTYPSGAGINYGKIVEARLDNVNVFRVGGDGIIFGDNSTDTWHSYMNDCYVNNPGGRAFVIGTKWFRGKNIRSDAGTVACELLAGAQETTLDAFHFEGWSQNALKISGGRIQTMGRCISANTFAGSGAVHVDFMNVSGAFVTTLRGIHFFGQSNTAVRLGGSQNTFVSVEDCNIENAAVGVDVNGGENCSIRNNNFYQCGYAFRQNASGLIFAGNTTELTVNAQVGQFVAGVNSSYTNNRLDKQLNSSGLILASNTNTASGNKGWVTKSGGTTAAITNGTAVPHGLPGQPAEVHATPTTGGWTSFHITSDATNLYFNHTGISTVQYHWTARLQCDRQ